jgi:NitT/TauT family transport system substrate-binding protein
MGYGRLLGGLTWFRPLAARPERGTAMAARPECSTATGKLLGVVALGAALAISACGGTSAAPAGSPSTSSSAAVSPAASAALAPFRLAINGTTPVDVFAWIALDQGIFAKHGLKVDLQGMNGSASMQALIAGDIDSAVHSPPLVLAAQANNADMKVVAVMSPVYDHVMVVSNDITSPDQLRGKKVGAPSLTAPEAASLKRVLAKSGLQQGKDYTLVETGNSGGQSGVVAALATHQIDGIATQLEVARQALDQGGFHILFDLATMPDLVAANEVVALKGSYVQANPARVQALVDSMIESIRFMHENKAATEDAFRKHYKLDNQQDLDDRYDRELQVTAKKPTPTKDEFADVAAAMPKDAKAVTDDQMAAMLDTRFVDDAVKRGLTNF